MKKIYLITTFLLAFIIPTQAQIGLEMHTISSASNSYSSSSIKLDWTIGELAAVTTISGNNYTLTQGLHQPDKFTVGINDFELQNFSINLYPNPAVSQINLDLIGNIGSDVVIKIYDATGRIVIPAHSVKLFQDITPTQIDVSTLAQGAYFIEISSENKNFRTAISFIKSFGF